MRVAGKPDAEFLKWLAARDIFLGVKHKKQDIAKGLELAAACDYPEAKWLVSLFPRSLGIPTVSKAVHTFLSLGPNDSRGLAFAALVGEVIDKTLLKPAAELGNALAQSWLSLFGHSSDRFGLARQAAEAGEPNGMEALAVCYFEGLGVERNVAMAKHWWIKAAECNDTSALYHLGEQFCTRSAPDRYRYWVRAIKGGHVTTRIEFFKGVVVNVDAWSPNLETIFVIGEILNGNVLLPEGVVFGFPFKPGREREFEACVTCVERYKKWKGQCLAAINCFLVVARRLGVVKDMRRVICALLWAERVTWAK